MEANISPDRAVVRMWFLVGMHVKQADSFVSFKASLLTEDEQGTCSTYLQVLGQEIGNGLANQRSGRGVILHVT